MDSYRASKAWHLGHILASEVKSHLMAFPDDGSNLPGYMRVASVGIPYHIQISVGKKQKKGKLEAYEKARQAAIELQKHLLLAHDVKYLEKEAYDLLASKTIEIQKLLTALIRRLHFELAQGR